MSFATIGNLDVVDFRLTMPRWGVWCVEAALVDGQRPPSIKTTVAIGEKNQLQGTVDLAATYYDTTVIRVRAGAGGMAKVSTPKHYTNATFRLVLNDLARTAGEQVSTKCDADVLSRSLPQWTVLGWPVGRCLGQLVASSGSDVSWRFLPDGTLWVGREKWMPVEREHELIQLDPLCGNLTFASLDTLVLPGDLFLDQRVSYIEHSLLGNHIRSTLLVDETWAT